MTIIRGATTIERDEKTFIFDSVKQLLDEIFKKNDLKKENIQLKQENKSYKIQLEKVYNDKMELNIKYKELEQAAKSDKNFDWNSDISNSDFIKRLQN